MFFTLPSLQDQSEPAQQAPAQPDGLTMLNQMGPVSGGVTLADSKAASINGEDEESPNLQSAVDGAGTLKDVAAMGRMEEFAALSTNTFKSYMGPFGILSGLDGIRNAKTDIDAVGSGAGVLSGLVDTAAAAAPVANALGFEGAAGVLSGAGSSAAGPAAAGLAAGIAVAQRGDKMTKELHMYGDKEGVVGADGKPIARSATDWAADKAVEDTVGTADDHITRDANGVDHMTKEYGPSLGGCVEAAWNGITQAPQVIAAGLYGIAKDVWNGVGGLLSGADPLAQAKQAAIQESARGKLESAQVMMNMANKIPDDNPAKQIFLNQANEAAQEAKLIAGQGQPAPQGEQS